MDKNHPSLQKHIEKVLIHGFNEYTNLLSDWFRANNIKTGTKKADNLVQEAMAAKIHYEKMINEYHNSNDLKQKSLNTLRDVK